MLAQIVTFVFGLGVATVAFALIYKLMPRAKVEWHDVWIGAFVTAVLFSLGRFLIGLYIGKSGVASAFGAAGSLAIVFVWVYYSAQIFLLGAEFTWAYANAYGSMKNSQAAVAPDPSIPVSDAAVAPKSPSTTTVHAPSHVASAIPTPRSSPERSDAAPLIVGGVAAGVGLRYLLPWLVRKMILRR